MDIFEMVDSGGKGSRTTQLINKLMYISFKSFETIRTAATTIDAVAFDITSYRCVYREMH